MSYLSLYRKYRSQSFDEVSGQEHVTRTLQNALRAGRVAHAYLFSGPRGTGKTSTARLLARALNCEQGPGPAPCGECTACQEIRDGVSPSVIEIDAASSRGIDEIRDLRQRVMTVPSQAGARKVFIVDEVHMLTTEACNALLKTLEEPPAHVLFVLATTDAQKLPQTILSRCQRFEFRRGSVSLVGERLKHVAEAEGYTVEPEAVRLVARASGGSWRDAISLLEQVLSYGGSPVTAETAAAVLGAVGEAELLELADGLARSEGRTVYPIVERLISEGTEPRQLARDLGEHLRALLMADAGALPEDAFGEETRRRLVEQSAAFGTGRLVAALEALAQAEKEMRWSDSGRVVLEVALARVMLAGSSALSPGPSPHVGRGEAQGREAGARRDLTPGPSPGRRGEPKEPAGVGVAQPERQAALVEDQTEGAAEAEPAAATAEAPAAVEVGRPAEFDPFGQEELPQEVVGGPAAASARERDPARLARSAPDAGAGEVTNEFEAISRRWNVVVEELKRARAVTTAALLAEAEPVRCEGDTLVIGFRYSVLRDKWERGDNRQRLAAALQSVFGQKLLVRSEVLGEPASGGTPAAGPPTAGDGGASVGRNKAAETTAVGETAAPTSSREGARERPVPAGRPANGSGMLEGEPLLHEVIATFEGQIVEDRRE
jgi:DNA polymerase-3 subunit gamma/tau